jgi:hypothetical protein
MQRREFEPEGSHLGYGDSVTYYLGQKNAQKA